ncbi:hypothetical protein A7985_22705 [Pseudoalteromonas luteoviolacea]|uniref:[Acyl-carrier-protein] S-malonyltransferase-like inserted helical domain-containing protein n=1 Tax=Pseudoalteromonas luteoviolacea TaxID=43657 RepID=A0A1C0TK02_9GAMM|nr:hypothetical protein A7985_22705 [Pseudoalteromonas luteoviolacea]
MATPADTQDGVQGALIGNIKAHELGASSFRERYGLQYAYMAGSMYRGISSKELVVALGKANLLGCLGAAGMSLEQIRRDLGYIQSNLPSDRMYGANLICHLSRPTIEMDRVELFIEMGVRCIEAAAFMVMTPALVYYRLQGLSKASDGTIQCQNHIIAKVSRPEVAKAFLNPAPMDIVQKLLAQGKITQEQAELSQQIPMSHDICVEADSGGHTDQGVACVLFPAIALIRDEMQQKYPHTGRIHVGLGGGIGAPQAVVSAFMMDADFILTGSINQCTVESGASPEVKDLLANINVQDTDYAPAGDMFEIGARVQVLKKGVFFPARGNKLYNLYKQHDSWFDIPEQTRQQIERSFFHKSFEEVWQEVIEHNERKGQLKNLEEAQSNDKHKMALAFRWYFAYTNRLAINGDLSDKANFQVHTGPALGAFNQWVKGTELASWQNRHVDKIAEKLMCAAAEQLNNQLNSLFKNNHNK